MSADLARVLLDSLDDVTLAELAQRIAPHLTSTNSTSALTVDAAAATASVSPKTIRRAVAAGTLPASKIAGRWRIDPDDLTTWAQAGAPTRAHLAPTASGRRHSQRHGGADAILAATPRAA